jgi:Ca-activated chloride channel family protein
MRQRAWPVVACVGLGFGLLAGAVPAPAQVLERLPAFSARLVATGTENAGQAFLPLVDEQLTVDVDGQYASTRLQQIYVNKAGTTIEGLYTLDAGTGTRAEGFAYWNGEQKIVGEVFEQETARRVYQRVTEQRRDPGLLEEKSEGVFTFRVSPIVPDEKKRVEVVYGQWLSRRAGAVELRAPVARRETAVAVTINDNRPLKGITSPTHGIEVKRLEQGKLLIRARQALKRDERAFVLRYEIADAPWTPAAYFHREAGQDGHFTLALAAPPLPHTAVVPKDVTLVLDRSGSMAGEMIRQARAACVDIIQRLGPEDRVNVMVFDSTVESLYPKPRKATAAIRRQAGDYVEMVRDGGGTNIARALGMALDAQETGDHPRVVLFFTDGQSDINDAMATARADKRDVRVFTVGFGPDVNRRFLSRLASAKRGRFTFIPSAAAVEREVGILYRQIGAPVLVDLALEVEGAAAGEVYPRTLPDIYLDDELRINGRLRGQGQVKLTLRARDKGKAVAFHATMDLPRESRRTWVGRQWAQSRVDDLLDEIAVGGHKPELAREVTDLALAYNFATPYTAFLAIPASELDAVSASELGSARARKAAVLRRRPEAIGVAVEGGEGQDDDRSQAKLAAPPAAPPGPTFRSRPVSGFDDGDALSGHMNESASEVLAEGAPHRSPSPVSGSTALPSEQESAKKTRAGCASCAVGSPARPSVATALALALVLVTLSGRRRRRR